jgi:hypothetical protein
MYDDKTREYNRTWYSKHADVRRAAVQRRRDYLRLWLRDYKRSLSCSRCEETDPVCLEFHHVGDDEKEISISKAPTNGWSIERTLREISKCEVLCSNCHKKEHRESLGW